MAGLREELVSKRCIGRFGATGDHSEAGGDVRRNIRTIRDRWFKLPLEIVLEPIFEADFEDNTYGYRPRRSAVDAVRKRPADLPGLYRRSRRRFVEYFDTIRASHLEDRWPDASSTGT